MSDIKTALVTGASRGIGKAIAVKLKADNYKVLGTATSDHGVDTLNSNGIEGYLLDLNSKDSIDSFWSQLESDNKTISVLVNNAGITRDNIVLRMSDEEWSDIMNVHLYGTMQLSKRALKMMLKNKWGRIINLSSASASIGNRGQSNYAASKAGIIGFSKSIALELGSRNIRSNVVAPGFIETEMTNLLAEDILKKWKEGIPLKRGGNVEDVANACLFLASDLSKYITGQVLQVDGGMLT